MGVNSLRNQVLFTDGGQHSRLVWRLKIKPFPHIHPGPSWLRMIDLRVLTELGGLDNDASRKNEVVVDICLD
jgi:hypothetical protein